MSICEFHPRCCIKIGVGYQPWPARQFDCTYDDSSSVDALRLCHGYPPLHWLDSTEPTQRHLPVQSSSLLLSSWSISFISNLVNPPLEIFRVYHCKSFFSYSSKIFRNDSSVCFGGDPPPTNSEIIICSFLWRSSYKPPLSIVSGPSDSIHLRDRPELRINLEKFHC